MHYNFFNIKGEGREGGGCGGLKKEKGKNDDSPKKKPITELFGAQSPN